MSERQLPSTIDYSRVLPLSIPAIAKRHKFYPQNGTTFNFQGTSEIRIQVGSTNALLDASHGYLEFEVVNANAALNFGPDLGGGMNFFRRVAIEQGGKILSECLDANRLYSAILNPCQLSSGGKNSEGIKGSTRFNSGVLAASLAPAAPGLVADNYIGSAHNTDAYFAATVGHRFTMPVTSGLFGQDKLIPLPLVNPNEPITIVLNVGNPVDAGCWSGAAVVDSDIEIVNISYTSQLVEVGRDVIEQFRGVQNEMGGQLVLSGQDWETATDAVAAGAGNQQNLRLPVRKRSIKSIFWIAQSNNYANTLGPTTQAEVYSTSFCGSMNVASWNLKFGSVVFPSVPIQCWGDTTVAGNEFRRGECAMNLASAFGTLGWQNPTGTLNTLTYGTSQGGALATGDNGGAGPTTFVPESQATASVCPFGISTEAYSRAITESGVDMETLSQDTYLQLNWDGVVNSGIEDKTVHMYVLFDQHYYFNRDGSITFSN